jgi:hypothetical protein
MAGIPTLHIIMDTNCLYTEAEDKLLRLEISKYIKSSPGRDTSLKWYIPGIVKMERHFQMADKAVKYLDTVNKLERRYYTRDPNGRHNGFDQQSHR